MHVKYESSGPCSFRVEDFLCFFPMGANGPRGGVIFDPRGMVGKFIKRTTIHCYIQNMKALDLVVSKKKIFLMFYP